MIWVYDSVFSALVDVLSNIQWNVNIIMQIQMLLFRNAKKRITQISLCSVCQSYETEVTSSCQVVGTRWIDNNPFIVHCLSIQYCITSCLICDAASSFPITCSINKYTFIASTHSLSIITNVQCSQLILILCIQWKSIWEIVRESHFSH